jgi:hypothetical protein
VSLARIIPSVGRAFAGTHGLRCNLPIESSCCVERTPTNAASTGSDTGQHTFPHGLCGKNRKALRAFYSRFGRLGRTAASGHRDVERLPFRVNQSAVSG